MHSTCRTGATIECPCGGCRFDRRDVATINESDDGRILENFLPAGIFLPTNRIGHLLGLLTNALTRDIRERAGRIEQTG